MADFGFRILDFGFWILDFGFKDSRKDAMTQRDAKFFWISDFRFQI